MDIKSTHLISFLWGFAEATFFFIVPDVWLSLIALDRKKEAFINVVYATIGALLGGVVLYVSAHYFLSEILYFLNCIPAVSDPMIYDVKEAIAEKGFLISLFSGMVSGIPYKIFATWAPSQSVDLLLFLIASVLARSVRFLAVIGMTCIILNILVKRMRLKYLINTHLVCWIIFYVYYFYLMGI